jgi:ferrous-iron efflux pump FieF
MVDTHAVSVTGEAAGRLMRRATYASMVVAATLIVAKFAAWVLTDSVAMLSSLVDSSLDLVSSTVTFFAVRQALIPADADHRFGHGKAEALGGMAQAGFIAAASIGVLLTVSERFQNPKPVQAELVGVLVNGFAMALTLVLVAYQRRVQRKTGSLAIGADSAHYTTDLVSNAVVAVGMVATIRLGQPLIDLAVAVGVAAYLGYSAIDIFRQAFDVLMDRELPHAERQRILEIARVRPEVKGAHDLRTRSGGLTKFVQLHIELDPSLSFVGAHAIGDLIEAEIERAFPGAEVIVHVDPLGVPERHPRDFE